MTKQQAREIAEAVDRVAMGRFLVEYAAYRGTSEDAHAKRVAGLQEVIDELTRKLEET